MAFSNFPAAALLEVDLGKDFRVPALPFISAGSGGYCRKRGPVAWWALLPVPCGIQCPESSTWTSSQGDRWGGKSQDAGGHPKQESAYPSLLQLHLGYPRLIHRPLASNRSRHLGCSVTLVEAATETVPLQTWAGIEFLCPLQVPMRLISMATLLCHL